MNILIWILPVVLFLLIVFYFPRYGLLTRLKAWREARARELAEDALKHLLDREQQGRHASPESLAGTLEISPQRAFRLIARMEAQSLVQSRGHEIHLTVEGERWALHVVRAHRLWERYLADEARMPLKKVHREAHRREHRLTETELNNLDAALGYPTTDPHGDPIPGRDGQLRAVDAIPLTAIQEESAGRIVHLEDEPAIAYEQILAAGLRLGQEVRLIEKNPQRYVLSDGENEYRLAPSVAANVQVTLLPQPEPIHQNVIPLWQLAHNQSAKIISLDAGVQGFTRRRFLDLGLTPGTLINPELQNFFGDPRAYRIRGTLIALRKDQADQIWVKPV
jgi:DtxR family Mn-dependent transcriptional regulator